MPRGISSTRRSRVACNLALMLALGCCAVIAAPRAASAQIELGGKPLDPAQPLLLAVDADDDDDDGTVDAQQSERVPPDDLIELVLQAGHGDARLATLGGLRVLRRGVALALPATIAADELPTPIQLQATRPALAGHPVALLVTTGNDTQRVAVHTVELAVLDGRNHPLNPARDALSVSHRVTNDRSLPRSDDYELVSSDLDNVRIQIFDAAAPGMHLSAKLEAVGADGTHIRSGLELSLVRADVTQPFRSRFIRLVGDNVDLEARGVAGQILKVALRDRVRVVYESALGRVQQVMRVGRPGDEPGPMAARRATLRVVVLRAKPGGAPVIGADDMAALRIVREELLLANEIWLQCLLTFGAPAETSIAIVDPPGTTLVSVADGDGLPAAGGTIRMRIDGRVLGPLEIARGAAPQDTALRLAQAAQALGFNATVTGNPQAVFGAGTSADVLIRRRSGEFVRIEAIEGVPLTTDKLQRLAIGSVDLGDGLEEFDNMTAQSGTLEERTLVKALSDDDPSSIDLFIVNRFTHGTRQGEAFIAASSGPITNSVILDRNGLRQRETAWTLAHELGHVLLNQPLHPDNVGADVPILLMDSDNNRGTVNGPKRLLKNECLRVRYEAGRHLAPPLLYPYDARSAKTAVDKNDPARGVSEQ